MARIIYPQPDGRLAVIIPTGELSIEQVCQKDVPANTPYLVVEDDVIPTDRVFRNAWEADFSNPDGYGADFGIGSFNAVTGYSEEGEPVLETREELG